MMLTICSLIVAVLIGFAFGFWFSQTLRPKIVGTLKAKNDSEGTYLFLEVEDMPYIEQNDYITLKVDLS